MILSTETEIRGECLLLIDSIEMTMTVTAMATTLSPESFTLLARVRDISTNPPGNYQAAICAEIRIITTHKTTIELALYKYASVNITKKSLLVCCYYVHFFPYSHIERKPNFLRNLLHLFDSRRFSNGIDDDIQKWKTLRLKKNVVDVQIDAHLIRLGDRKNFLLCFHLLFAPKDDPIKISFKLDYRKALIIMSNVWCKQ